MAGDWIKLRTNLWTDPRVAAMCAKTGASCAQIVGACAIVWSIADTHSDDGCLWGYTPAQLDTIVSLTGFCDAMSQLQFKGKSSPWMELGEGFVRLVDFKKHNGKTAKKRAQTALRASRLRSAGSVTKRAPRADTDAEADADKNRITAAAAAGVSSARSATAAAAGRQREYRVLAAVSKCKGDRAFAFELIRSALATEAIEQVAAEVVAQHDVRNPAGLMRSKLAEFGYEKRRRAN